MMIEVEIAMGITKFKDDGTKSDVNAYIVLKDGEEAFVAEMCLFGSDQNKSKMITAALNYVLKQAKQ